MTTLDIHRSIMLEHPALTAWRELQPQRVDPCGIHTLKEKDRSAVYRLDGVGAEGSAVIAKVNRKGGLLLERTIYEEVLADAPVPALHCYGFVTGHNGRDSWLFLEEAGGEIYSAYNPTHRRLAGQWLAQMHTAMAGVAAVGRLPDRGPAHYLQHVQSARDTIVRNLSNPVLTPSDVSELTALVVLLEALDAHWDQVEGGCAAMPRTLVHGDFQARNMRVRMSQGGLALAPFDWELAGWGVPAPDLDQTTGRTARADLTAYWSVVRTAWPHYEVHDIQQWAAYGRLFRLLAATHWHSLEIAHDWADAIVDKMRVYHAKLAQVIQKLPLSFQVPEWRSKPVSTALSLVPDVHTLTRGLTSVLCAQQSPDAQVTIVQREPTNEGTFPKEVVTCRRDDGTAVQMLCKYAAGHSHDAHGHRGGVAYEATVYRQVLQPLAVSTPAFYGMHTDDKMGDTWLILEYLDASLRLEHAPDPAAVVMAACWIGCFHAQNEARHSSAPIPFLNTYDPAYYQGWIRRTALFAEPVQQRLPWLTPLCERSQRALALLLAPPVTIIHGEYYPKNVLYREGIIYPVDWESAAIAAGEIDVACLTDRWPADTVRECELAYQQARWPQGAPADFARRLAAARLYMHFRWLGDRPEWTTRQQYWRFDHLRAMGEQLGLI